MDDLDGNYGIERLDVVDIVFADIPFGGLAAALRRYNYGAKGHGDAAGWIVLSMPGGPGDVAQFCAKTDHNVEIAINLNSAHFLGLVKLGSAPDAGE